MTMRPKRSSQPSDGNDEFQDPLKNYDPPTYADDFERSLVEGKLVEMKTTPFDTVSPQTTVEQAMRKLVELDVACLMVVDGEKLVGIFSERDVLDRVADDFAATRSRPISSVMTKDPIVVHDTDSPAKAMNLMAVGGFRHVPILDVNNKVVGILGPRRVTEYLQKFMG